MRRVGEFELIEKFFSRPPRQRSPGERAAAARGVALGVGDDCALLQPAPGMQLAISSDMLVEGRHFLSTVAPERLGHKALAVNLSDLAACGAEPLGFTLALALPRADEAFIAALAHGLLALADAHDIELIGGDTTAGPLNICITVFGQLPPGQALLRSGARPGDELWVSGVLGDARLALECFRGTLSLPGEHLQQVRLAMEQPQPRLTLGRALRGIASSAIDLSDGLVGDLGHILRRSGGLSAVVDIDAMPRSGALGGQPDAVQRLCLLAGGDDYELLFTAPREAHGDVLAAGRTAGVAVSCFGRIEAEGHGGLRVVDGSGRSVAAPQAGFDHFK